ncbi:coiled-coil domain-containing protein 34 isoform X2 [Latimeria chalumnae]|uniref:coiled-coil domain-containing protein 34 isoform X2 n=1 Tax=Latimeria chalumnae TaxID=7897 RepID=UPI0003C1172A|nr:PREDICTED: coiled-coil domain-containing protein 34 isoform X2 [Latimeria chalumnae]|eukprot:XP_005995125.1 PREDICTED: coiled-coil domain-containing protein 34 isoform X2 [Latimeria chalumnae]
MASTPSWQSSLTTRKSNSHSTPQKSSQREEILPRSKSCDLNSTGDSTYSLLSPIYHESFESEEEENEAPSKQETSAQDSKLQSSTELSAVKPKKKKEVLPLTDIQLTPWEKWLINKVKEERMQKRNKTLEEMRLQPERLKQQQEEERKKMLADEKVKDWIQKKTEEEKIVKEQKLNKKLEEKANQEHENRLLEEKAREKYEDWLNKKKKEEQLKKQKEKEEEEKRAAELRERKENAEKTFQEWLRNANAKPNPVLHSCGYANGKRTGYYDGSSYPTPSFYNPIPWKPIHIPPPEDTARKNTLKKKKNRSTFRQFYRPSTAVLSKPKDNLGIGNLCQKAKKH